MALTPVYLGDKSALARLHRTEAAWLRTEIANGNVRRSSMTDLEILYSATGHQQLIEIKASREAGFQRVDTLQRDWDRAVEVISLLAQHGKHRSVGIPDLLIAAVAERHRLTVVHYDTDFDHVAEVTGQDVRWLAPRGTL